MDINTEFITTGCTRNPACISWNTQRNLIAFAGGRSVALLSPGEDAVSYAEILSVNHSHAQNVVQCQWVQSVATSLPDQVVAQDENDRVALISADMGGSLGLWRYVAQADKQTLQLISQFPEVHGDSVSALCALRISDNTTAIISGDRAGKLAFSTFDGTSLIQISSITNPKVRPLCADMAVLLAAVGGDDSMIHVYVADVVKKSLTRVHSLHGHSDWVRDVRFSRHCIDQDVMLASCSQDTHIRLWKFSGESSPIQYESVADLPADRDIELKSERFFYEVMDASVADIPDDPVNLSYCVSLEAVLSGHTEWVFAVSWCATDVNRLLSASMDKSLIVWQYDTDAQLWIDQVRLGEQGGQSAGYYGAAMNAAGTAVCTQSYTGAVLLWTQDSPDRWVQRCTPGGHARAVTDCRWDMTGSYLLSTSHDQTTRCWAPVKHQNRSHIYEIGRPQVHGHDLQCLAVLNGQFVSGAEEKLLRVFSPPRSFADAVQSLCVDHLVQKLSLSSVDLAVGASLPSLGLSNKQVDQPSQDPSHYFESKHFDAPPCEQDLLQNTLWPESRKLYGHGFELFAVCSNHSGSLVASACKASQATHAVIIVWDTTTWAPLVQLTAHTLTVTALAFSPDDRWLLSVSRDRHWFLSTIDNAGQWSVVTSSHKCAKSDWHARIIWDCCWAPDSKTFFTVSRDKKVIGWRLTADDSAAGTATVTRVMSTAMETSANSCSCAPMVVRRDDGRHFLLAVGLESGEIHVQLLREDSLNVVQTTSFRPHSSTVQRLRFRPIAGRWNTLKEDSSDRIYEVASCSDDGILAVHRIDV